MKKLIPLLVLSLFIAFSCQDSFQPETVTIDQQEQEQTKQKDAYFIHVSSGPEAKQKVLMAFTLADLMADDHPVTMFFDYEGISVITNEAENLEMENFISSTNALFSLKNKGVTIMACPMCMKVKGVEAEDLQEGIIVADKEKFFDETAARIISLDY